MKTKQASIIGLLTLVLIAGAAVVDEALADVKVRATLTTPHVRLHVTNAPAGAYRHVVRGYRPYHYRVRYDVSRRDRLMATRLARYTGISRRELLDLKRYGYSWREIGRWYEIPRQIVRAASDNRSWQRFLKRDRIHDRHGRDVCRYDRKYDRRYSAFDR